MHNGDPLCQGGCCRGSCPHWGGLSPALQPHSCGADLLAVSIWVGVGRLGSLGVPGEKLKWGPLHQLYSYLDFFFLILTEIKTANNFFIRSLVDRIIDEILKTEIILKLACSRPNNLRRISTKSTQNMVI